MENLGQVCGSSSLRRLRHDGAATGNGHRRITPAAPILSPERRPPDIVNGDAADSLPQRSSSRFDARRFARKRFTSQSRNARDPGPTYACTHHRTMRKGTGNGNHHSNGVQCG